MQRTKRLAVIGGGWAGIASAVEATRLGYQVTLFEMAPQLGGRARAVPGDEPGLDNGQHILIGAYKETLRLLRTVGVDEAACFLRTPLRISDPQGMGLHLRPGPPMLAFAQAVWGHGTWRLRDKLSLLRVAAGWALRGFRCDPSSSVVDITTALPEAICRDLIDPLCVAALNTESRDASARVFLRVLHDALFSGSGSADLLLPRVSLSDLLPIPARRWLTEAGAGIRLSHRVDRLEAHGDEWLVDQLPFDYVVLATTPTEAARLTRTVAPDWANRAASLRYEPIITLYLRSAGTVLPAPMLALRTDASSPAQFVFDRGQLGGPSGLLAFVVSGARTWVDRGVDITLQATLRQARAALGNHLKSPIAVIKVLTEKRATFRCTPGLLRAAQRIAPGLHASGDHVEGPYPATLEGAVRCAVSAVRSFK